MSASTNAGQVVTPELRQWAQQAIEQEKNLNVPSSADAMAVLYFHNRSGMAELNPLQKGLTVMLISDLSRLEIFPLVERAELQALVEELGFGQSELVDPATAAEIGRLLHAKFLVGGSFDPHPEKRLQIHSSLLDVVPETATALPRVDGRLQNLLDLEKNLLDHIVTALNLELSQDQKATLRKPLSHSFDALMALFMGIDAADQGKYDEAGRHYAAALELDPRLVLAKDALNELHMLKLIDATKTTRLLLRKTRQRTSFTTTLTPALPLSRIPHPSGAVESDRRIDLLD
jgi:TolB-like protein